MREPPLEVNGITWPTVPAVPTEASAAVQVQVPVGHVPEYAARKMPAPWPTATRNRLPLASRPAYRPMHAAPPAAAPNPVSVHGPAGEFPARQYTPPPVLVPYCWFTPA